MHALQGILLGNGALPEGFPGEVYCLQTITVAIWRILGLIGTDVQRVGKLSNHHPGGAAAAVGFAYMQHSCCNIYLTVPVGNIMPVCEIMKIVMYVHTVMAKLYARAGVSNWSEGSFVEICRSIYGVQNL